MLELTNTLESSAGPVFYDSFGDGTDVVLVHGTPANSVIWEETVGFLKNDYRFHVLDLPGYGRSAKFDGQDVTLRRFAKVVAEVVTELGLESPIMVGHDFGAAAVMGAHLVEGIAVRSLVVVDGVVVGPWGTPFSRHVKEHESVFAAVPDYVHEAAIEAHLKTAFFRTPRADVIDSLLEPWRGDAGKAAYYRQVGQYDYAYTDLLETKYPDVAVPTLVLWGQEDAWGGYSMGERLCALVPNSELRLLPDAGHFPMIDTPRGFSINLANWLASLN